MKSLREIHTFRLNHEADSISRLCDIRQLDELKGRTLNKDFVFIGSGSNCLFLSDITIPVVINQFKGIELKEDEKGYLVTVFSGENWHDFVKWTLDNHIYGLENLALIPGTVGAAPIQNIGAYGKEVSEFIDSVEYFDLRTGATNRLSNGECLFGYRDSIFKGQLRDSAIVTKVIFRIPKSWKPNIQYGDLKTLKEPTPENIFNKVIAIRSAKLPNPDVLGNAGSFFKNPVLTESKVLALLQEFPDMPNYEMNGNYRKVAAGWLIDKCGLKGFDNGDVQVHLKQALVLVNKSDTAVGEDVIQVANQVINKVFAKFEIRLEPEVRFFGKNGELSLPQMGGH